MPGWLGMTLWVGVFVMPKRTDPCVGAFSQLGMIFVFPGRFRVAESLQ